MRAAGTMRVRARRALVGSAAAAVLAATAVGTSASAQPAGGDPYDSLELGSPAPLRPISAHEPGAADRYDLAGGCFVL